MELKHSSSITSQRNYNSNITNIVVQYVSELSNINPMMTAFMNA